MRLIKGLFGFLLLFAVSCQGGEVRVNSPRKVKCESVVLAADNFETVNFPGRVVAATDVNLGFRIAGIVDEICVADGAYVRKGDVVARLDSRDYALQLAATEAEYSAIKAEVDRVVALYEDESISANDYDKAVNGLKAITAKLSAHQNALADTELRAPFDGYIQKSNFDLGEAVAAGTPVVSIVSASAPEITINIPAAYYIKRELFASATARFELLGDETFELTLKSISPKANLNQLYKATFEVKSRGGVLPAVGMIAMVEMNYKQTNDTKELLVIPFKSIVERDGDSYVWVVKGGKVESRRVKVMEIKSNGKALLSEGVEVGDMVVTAGVRSLKDGESVEILESASKSNVGGVL